MKTNPSDLAQAQPRFVKLFSSRGPILSAGLLVLLFTALAHPAAAQVDPNLLQSLRWRSIGPMRGGRTRAVAGVPSQPNVFYIAQVNGGVQKNY